MNNTEQQNQSKKHRWYDVIVAWANGEKIQVKSVRDGLGWDDFIPAFEEDCPQWNDLDFEWRIKPKTVTKRYRMALVNSHEGSRKVIAVETTYSTIDDPVEYNTLGFIRWVGDSAEVEIEV